MGLFLEIKIRQDGKERWVDASKFLKYMLKEHLNEESSQGGAIPYPDEENKREIFEMWWNLYDKKRSKKKTFNYWCKNIKTDLVSDIMKHTKNYIQTTEKQFRKDPHSYLLNECWEDEIILKPEFAEKQKLEYIEKKREEEYIKKKQEQKRIDEESADEDWKREFFNGLKKDLINKGRDKMSITNESETS